jgi:hypothetical protein
VAQEVITVSQEVIAVPRGVITASQEVIAAPQEVITVSVEAAEDPTVSWRGPLGVHSGPRAVRTRPIRDPIVHVGNERGPVVVVGFNQGLLRRAPLVPRGDGEVVRWSLCGRCVPLRTAIVARRTPSGAERTPRGPLATPTGDGGVFRGRLRVGSGGVMKPAGDFGVRGARVCDLWAAQVTC